MKIVILTALVLVGCGGGGVKAPGPFDGRYIGVEEPAGTTPFVQIQIDKGRIAGGHITEENRFVDKFSGSVAKDGTLILGKETGRLWWGDPGHLLGETPGKSYHLLVAP